MPNTPRLLIVDDEDRIREVVKEYALFEGYEVVEAADGMQAVDRIKSDSDGFDCVVMDIMMPRLDGYSACKEIKKISPATPVIMLSARGEEYDKLFGFEVGIDDYVVKPFSPKELMARIKVAIKRGQAPVAKDVIKYKGLEINFAAREVTIDGQKVQMTPKEYDILFFLAKNMNIAMSREKLLEEVWGFDFYGDDRTVDTHIKMLRNSLGPYRDLIVTLRGMGYKFDNIKG